MVLLLYRMIPFTFQSSIWVILQRESHADSSAQWLWFTVLYEEKTVLILRSRSVLWCWRCHSLSCCSRSCQKSFEALIKNLYIKYNSSRYLSVQTAPRLVQRLMLAVKLFLHWDVFLLANWIQKCSSTGFQSAICFYCKSGEVCVGASRCIISSPWNQKLHDEPLLASHMVGRWTNLST